MNWKRNLVPLFRADLNKVSILHIFGMNKSWKEKWGGTVEALGTVHDSKSINHLALRRIVRAFS